MTEVEQLMIAGKPLSKREKVRNALILTGLFTIAVKLLSLSSVSDISPYRSPSGVVGRQNHTDEILAYRGSGRIDPTKENCPYLGAPQSGGVFTEVTDTSQPAYPQSSTLL
jgi:hypothetical protein